MKELLNKIHHADCLEFMKQLPDKCVDLILCDLPYGITGCSWDSVIPFEDLWEQYNRIIKDKSAIILTASQPFTTKLISSNYKSFKFCWYWQKSKGANIGTTSFMPLKIIEDICIFGKGKLKYNPQKNKLVKPRIADFRSSKNNKSDSVTIDKDLNIVKTYDESTPINLIYASTDGDGRIHPTQKPVKLFEYLILTYSNEGDIVLDNCSGSGTTALACHNTDRQFICIEKDADYHAASVERLEQHKRQLRLL